MKTFLVITKIKTEELRDNYTSQYKVDENGKKYFYVNVYNETWKYIMESTNKNNIYKYFKKTAHRVVNVKEIEPFKNKKAKQKKESTFTLGELFKDQLAEFNDKNYNSPYVNEKSKKQLKKSFSKEEKRYVKEEE